MKLLYGGRRQNRAESQLCIARSDDAQKISRKIENWGSALSVSQGHASQHVRDTVIITSLMVFASGDHAEDGSGLLFPGIADTDHRSHCRGIRSRNGGKKGGGGVCLRCLQKGNATPRIKCQQGRGESLALLFNGDVTSPLNDFCKRADRSGRIDVKSGANDFATTIIAANADDGWGLLRGDGSNGGRDFF